MAGRFNGAGNIAAMAVVAPAVAGNYCVVESQSNPGGNAATIAAGKVARDGAVTDGRCTIIENAAAGAGIKISVTVIILDGVVSGNSTVTDGKSAVVVNSAAVSAV